MQTFNTVFNSVNKITATTTDTYTLNFSIDADKKIFFNAVSFTDNATRESGYYFVLKDSSGTQIAITFDGSKYLTDTFSGKVPTGNYSLEIHADNAKNHSVIIGFENWNSFNTYQIKDFSTTGASNMAETTTTTTTTTTPRVYTAEEKADMAKLSLLRKKIMSGVDITTEEAIFNALRVTALTNTVMNTISQGVHSYEAFKTLGFTDTQITSIFQIINLKVDSAKYEVEVAISSIETNKTLLSSFMSYLKTNNIAYPDLAGVFASIRTTPTLVDAIKTWNKTRTV